MRHGAQCNPNNYLTCMLGLSSCTTPPRGMDYMIEGPVTHQTSWCHNRQHIFTTWAPQNLYQKIVFHYSSQVRRTDDKIGNAGKKVLPIWTLCMSLYRGASKMFHTSSESFCAVFLKVWCTRLGQEPLRTLLPFCCKLEGKMQCLSTLIFQKICWCAKGVTV